MRISGRVGLQIALSLLASQIAFGQIQVSQSQARVNDFARVLSATTTERLETTLKEFADRADIDLRVVTIPSSQLKGRPIEEYTRNLGRTWGVGRRNDNRGLILLLSIGPADKEGVHHGSTRLQVTRSLEAEIPNELAGEMIRKMRESLKAGWFDEAVTIGLDAITSAVDSKQSVVQSGAGGSTPSQRTSPATGIPADVQFGSPSFSTFQSMFGIFSCAVPIILIVAVFLAIRRAARPDYPWGYGRGSRMGYWRRGGTHIVGTGFTRYDTDPVDPSSGIMSAATDWNSTSTPSESDSSSSWGDAGATSSWSDAGSTSSWSDSSTTSSGSDSSSSSSCDSGSTSSGGGDSGGGGSTDNW